MNEKRAAAYRQGVITLVILAVLTAVEYWIGISIGNPTVWLIIIALLKAAAIAQSFMHIARLWSEESH
ncbi:MAG: cytochrome C oxidase subunit IV family protein [Anaerolineae bacterium]